MLGISLKLVGKTTLDERVREGDFVELYHQHKHETLRYLISRTRDAERADDLFQKTFMKLLKSIRKNKVRRDTVGPYIRRLAYSCFVDDYHIVKKNEQLQTNLKLLGASRTEEEPQTRPDHSARIQSIIQQELAAGALKPEWSEAFRLRFYDQLGWEAIATQLGVTRKTASAHVEAVIRHLKTVFQKSGLTPEELGWD